jgi:hypothetical protein
MGGIITVMMNGSWNINQDSLLIFPKLLMRFKVIILKSFTQDLLPLMMTSMDKFQNLKKSTLITPNMIRIKEIFGKWLTI